MPTCSLGEKESAFTQQLWSSKHTYMPKHCQKLCNTCYCIPRQEKAHFPLTSCRMQGIRKCPFGTTSVRTAPLVKRDELYMPGPGHYHQQSQPQGEQGGGEGGKGANSKPQRLSHTFASTSKRLYSPPSIVTVSLHNTHLIINDHFLC